MSEPTQYPAQDTEIITNNYIETVGMRLDDLADRLNVSQEQLLALIDNKSADFEEFNDNFRPPEDLWHTDPNDTTPGEWINAEIIRKQLGMHGHAFCRLLDGKDFETNRYREQLRFFAIHGKRGTFFHPLELKYLYIHMSSYLKYCEKNGLEPITVPTENDLLKNRINELESEVESNKAEIKKLKSKNSSLSRKLSKEESSNYDEFLMYVDAALKVYDKWQENVTRGKAKNDFTANDVLKYSELSSREESRNLKYMLEDSGKIPIRQPNSQNQPKASRKMG